MMFNSWTNSDIIQLIQTIVLLVTIFILIYRIQKEIVKFRCLMKIYSDQLFISNNQNWISFYSEYTKRYSEILAILPQNFFDSQWDDKINKEMMIPMRRYFDLCYEQWSLYYKHKKIDTFLWDEWKYNMINTMKIPAFIAYWEEVKKNTCLENAFIEFIDENIKDATCVK